MSERRERMPPRGAGPTPGRGGGALKIALRGCLRTLALGLAAAGCAQFVDDPHIIDAGGFPDFRRSEPPGSGPADASGRPADFDASGAADAEAVNADAADPTDAAAPLPDVAPATQPPTQPPADDYEFCVAETNRYRGQVGQPAVVRNQAIEAYATEGAREDHTHQTPHGHFQSTGGGGVAYAENACPGWLGWAVQGSIRATVANCLAAFFSEGPGGGHYENMVGPYGSVGCGWYVDENQNITIVQDFGP